MKKKAKKLICLITMCSIILSATCITAFAGTSRVSGTSYYGKSYTAKLTLVDSACEATVSTSSSALLTLTGSAKQVCGSRTSTKGLNATSATGTSNGKTINPDTSFSFVSATVIYTIDQVVEETLNETA